MIAAAQMDTQEAARFPVASPLLPMASYRHAHILEMKRWVLSAALGLLDTPSDANGARLVAEDMATREIGRGLHVTESRLLDEALRDVITARSIMRELEGRD